MKTRPLAQHLEELRSTLLKILMILAVAFVLCYALGTQLTEVLLAPLRKSLEGAGDIVYLGVLDKLLTEFHLSLYGAVIFSSPAWFYQLWLFIRPGLYPHEIRVVRSFWAVGFFLFILGALFGYLIVFPVAFQSLTSFGVEGVKAAIGLKEYALLSSKVLIFLGLAFQLPNALLILSFMGLTNKKSLRSMRGAIYVGLAFVSAIITPPDILTMLGLWVPLALLFELGLGAVAFAERYRRPLKEEGP